MLDHARAVLDHARAVLDHARAVLDHARAVLDHARAVLDHARAVLDHARAVLEDARAQYSTVRFAQAGEINNFSSDLRIFGRLCDSSLISVTDCLFRRVLSTFGKISLYFHLPHSVVVEV